MPPTLTLAVAVAMVLSLVLGALTQIVQTGTLFGTFIAPKSWLPAVTLAATFLSGVVGYFSGQHPLVLDGTVVFYGLVAGITSLLAGAVPGMAVHAHIVTPMLYRASVASSKLNATKVIS